MKDENIKEILEDIKKWHSKYMPKVKGETLLKIMITMKNKYGVRFIICPRREMGKKIIELLGGRNE